MRFLKLLLVLIVLAAIGLVGYAYFGDMDADPQETRSPVRLEGLGE